MAPLPYVAGALRLDLLWEDANDADLMTRFHFKYSGGPPAAADCLAIATAAYAAAVTSFQPHMNNNVALTGCDVRDLSGEEATSGVYSQTTGGDEAGTPLPAGVAVLINHFVARHYRGGKPRSYMPLFDASDVETASAWKSASQEALQSDFDDWIAAVEALTAGSTLLSDFANISYYQGYLAPRARSNGHLFYPAAPRAIPLKESIVSSSVNIKPGSQRRRNLH